MATGIGPSRVRREGARLVAVAGFEHWRALAQIPEGTWDKTQGAWIFPAGPEQERLLRARLGPVAFGESASVNQIEAPSPAGPGRPNGMGKQLLTDPGPRVTALLSAPSIHADQMNELTIGPAPADLPVPEIDGLRTRPWQHQIRAFHFLMGVLNRRGGALAAIGMGGGKTLVAIMIMADAQVQMCLIVCPLRVVPVWCKEIPKHLDRKLVFAALDDSAGTLPKRIALAEQKRREAAAKGLPLVVAVNYEACYRDEFMKWALGHTWGLVVADECLPAGSRISTPNGTVAVEDIRVGDVVLGFNHVTCRVVEATVLNTFRRISREPLVALHQSRMTGNHPVWTRRAGYIPADTVQPGDEVLIYAETQSANFSPRLRTMRRGVLRRQGDGFILQSELPLKTYKQDTGIPGAIQQADVGGYGQTRGEGQNTGAPPLRGESISAPGDASEITSTAQGDGLSDAQRRERARPESSPATTSQPLAVADGVGRSDPNGRAVGVPGSLQDRYRGPRYADGDRSGWLLPPSPRGQGTGRSEGRLSNGPGLAGAALLEPRDSGGSGAGSGYREVFNLETGSANYFVDGLLVHNCHKIKSPGGRASLAFKRLRNVAIRRLLLTGTPMPHSPLDVYAQFRFLDWTIFGSSFAAFRQYYAIFGGYQNKQVFGYKNLEILERKMAEVTFRVGKEVLDLPPEMHQEYTCELSPEARQVYRDIEKHLVAEIEAGTMTVANALVKLTRLQELTGGMIKTDHDHEYHRIDHSKLDLLEDVLEDIEPGEPVVVFCRFRADLDGVSEIAKRLDRPYMELSGRSDDLARWQEGPVGTSSPTAPRASLLAVQIASGGTGIDLTRARYAIYYSLSLSLGEFDQSMARVHRPGQLRPVLYIHLVAEHSVDRKIRRALERRAEVVESVLAQMRAIHEESFQ